MAEQRDALIISSTEISGLVSELNQAFSRLGDRIDRLEGLRDDPTFWSQNFYYKNQSLTAAQALRVSETNVTANTDKANFSKITDFDNLSVTNLTITGYGWYEDNVKCYFGTGFDSSVYWDGSDLYIKSENVTANDELRLTGWDKIVVPTYERHIQLDATPSGTVANQATGVTIGTAVGLQFSSVTDKYCGVQWEIPDDWDGTDAYIEIDWFPDSAAIDFSVGGEVVKWDIQYRSIAEGELITQGAAVTVTTTTAEDIAQYKTTHTRFTLDFDNANQPLTKQDHMYFLINRDTGVAGDFPGTVTVTAFEIVYNSTTLPTSN